MTDKEKSDNANIFNTYLKEANKRIRLQQAIFDKSIILLSSIFFIFTIYIITIYPTNNYLFKCLIMMSLFIFPLSLISSLVSVFCSTIANDLYINSNGCYNNKIKRWNRCVEFLNILAIISFAFALIIVVAYCSFNLLICPI